VEDITEALWGTRVSPSTVSELNQKIYAQIDAWRNRPIEGEHAYVYLDGIWLKRSWGGEVKKVAVLVAVAEPHPRVGRASRPDPIPAPSDRTDVRTDPRRRPFAGETTWARTTFFSRQGFSLFSRSHSDTSLMLTDGTKPSAAALRRGRTGQRDHLLLLLAGELRRPPLRGASKRALSNPPWQNRWRIAATHRDVQPTCSAICSSVRPSSVFNRMLARRTTRTGWVPVRTNTSNFDRSFLDN
jgi:hypothetical protein